MSASPDASPIVSAELPTVSAADVLDDAAWLETHPHRRYRLRPGWVVRRRPPGVFLRSPLPSSHRYVDTEASAEGAWWTCGYPFLTPAERQAMAKTARGKARNSKVRQAGS
jgi:hypothetical protein